jgi:hypothetical protein
VSYSWLQNQWQTDINNRHVVDIRKMPTGEGVLLLEVEESSPESNIRIILWLDGRENILFEQTMPEETADLVTWQLQERENRLLLEIPDLIRGAGTFYNFDLSVCGSGECSSEIHHFWSRPIWSPNGDHLLVRQYGLIWRQKGFESIPLADGMAPFWVDDDSYGFIRSLGEDEIVVVRNLGEDDYQGIVDTAELLSVLDQENRPKQMSIGHVAVDPANSNFWFILAFGLTVDGGAGEAFIFKLNRQTEDISLVVRSENLHSFGLSPVGGKLSATLYDLSSLSWKIIIHDVRSNLTVSHALRGGYAQQIPPIIDWSPDGQWLLAMNQGFLTLVDINSNEQKLVSPPEAGCTRAVWLAN